MSKYCIIIIIAFERKKNQMLLLQTVRNIVVLIKSAALFSINPDDKSTKNRE